MSREGRDRPDSLETLRGGPYGCGGGSSPGVLKIFTIPRNRRSGAPRRRNLVQAAQELADLVTDGPSDRKDVVRGKGEKTLDRPEDVLGLPPARVAGRCLLYTSPSPRD